MVTSFDWQSILLQWKQKIRAPRAEPEKRYVAEQMSMMYAPAWRHTHSHTWFLHEQGWGVATPFGEREQTGEWVSILVDSLCVPHNAMTNTIFHYLCFSQEHDLMKLPYYKKKSNNSGQEEWNGECASIFVDSLCCVPHHSWRRNMTNTICSYPCCSQE